MHSVDLGPQDKEVQYVFVCVYLWCACGHVIFHGASSLDPLPLDHSWTS